MTETTSRTVEWTEMAEDTYLNFDDVASLAAFTSGEAR